MWSGRLGEVRDDEVEVLGCLLPRSLRGPRRPWRRRRVATCAGCIAVAEVFGQRGVGVGVMPLDLGQEPLDRHGHELGAAEAGHVTEDMGRVEPLAGDVEFEGVDKSGGDVVEDQGGEVVVAEELLIAFEGARGDA